VAALTEDTVWVQEVWELRKVSLRALGGIEATRKELVLTPGPEASAERWRLQFSEAAEAQRWCRELQARRPALPPEGPPGDRHLPEGVSLVQRAPDVPHQSLGRVEFTDRSLWLANRGLQLRAGMLGADAVIAVEWQRCPDLGWGARLVNGWAVRVADAADRQRLRLRWYGEEVSALVNRLLLLLVLQAALLFGVGVFCAGGSKLHVPTGETREEALASAGLGLAVWFGWPLALVILLRVLRWPQLLRPVGLAVLAATTGRILAVWLGHFLALTTAGAATEGPQIWILADPVDWAFVIAGVVVCGRAWRLARDAPHILPRHVQAVSAARKVGGRGLLAVTGAYALAVLAFAGTIRYRNSAHLLQPGVDVRREQQALLAFNDGLAFAKKEQLDAADRSWQRAARLWEELTEGRPSPPLYRINLALTLNNLGWLRQQQGRVDEAEKYYARAVSLADALAGDPQADDEFRQTMEGAREALAGIRGDKLADSLKEKERTGVRKSEEADVQAAKDPARAEVLYQEAIALWEEILPHATNEKYRKAAVSRLATTWQQLGELQHHLGKRPQAEASLRKGIDYGEKAVAQDPERPLPRHNLEVARRLLEDMREQAQQEEMGRLAAAHRFADALELCLRGIKDQEEQVRAGKDREAAVRRLAHRLDRLAWFLAHCPDGRVRDTQAAVKQATRATELQPERGDYWYTLAMVQYRHGSWRDSLAVLESVKAREGGFDASAWLLAAMNRQHLGQKAEARAALRKAVEWIEEQQRKAEDNAMLRIQYELMRPGIEALRREAEALIEGKGPAGEGVG
jgi:tetratricopeptide (TPR) repeat protein